MAKCPFCYAIALRRWTELTPDSDAVCLNCGNFSPLPDQTIPVITAREKRQLHTRLSDRKAKATLSAEKARLELLATQLIAEGITSYQELKQRLSNETSEEMSLEVILKAVNNFKDSLEMQ